MLYTFYAICAYIMMRSVQVLTENMENKKYVRYITVAMAILALYASASSILNMYLNDSPFPFLGLNPKD